MSIQIGLDSVLEYNAGSDAVPSWVEVGYQVTGDLTIDRNTVDTTTKFNQGWGSKVGTFRTWSMSIEGKMDRGDQGIKYLENAAYLGTTVHVRFRTKTGTTVKWEGKGVLESWTYSFPVDDAAGFTGSVSGESVLTRTEP